MPEQPKRVELQDESYYILPDTRAYDSLLPQEGELDPENETVG
jgi:hypothetical protein